MLLKNFHIEHPRARRAIRRTWHVVSHSIFEKLFRIGCLLNSNKYECFSKSFYFFIHSIAKKNDQFGINHFSVKKLNYSEFTLFGSEVCS